MHKIKMDTKPELIRLEAVDPSAVPGSNMYIKNEVLYHVDTPSHHIVKKEDPKVYYDHPAHHHTSHHHHIQQETTKYIPDTVHNFQTKSMSISQYPKYQTPKLRAKSTYSPMKSTTAGGVGGGVMPTQQQQQQQIYMKHEPSADIMIEQIAEQQQHLRQDHNTVQVITPNANYAGQQQQQQHWNSDVTMTPIMEQQSMQSTTATDHNIAPDAIFIPESSSTGGDSSSDYNSMNAPTINLIPLMTPNGLVFVAANQATGTSTVISGMPTSSGAAATPAHQSHHHLQHNTTAVDSSIALQQQQQQPTPTRSYNRRKQPVAKRAAQQQPPVPTPHVEIVSQQMGGAGASGGGGENASNLIYTQNGPLLLLNEQQQQQQHRGSSTSASQQHHTSAAGSVAANDYKSQQVTTTPLIPEKGTVIVEEPPKAIYQSRYGSDINENSTHYNSKNGVKSGSGSNSGSSSGYRNTSTTNITQSDAELDLDAAITVFKIYK